MFQSLVDGLVNDIRARYLTPVLGLLKLRAASWYLEGVRKVRNIVLVICLLVLMITMIGAGLILIPIVVLMYCPWDLSTKAIVGLAIGVAYLLVPLTFITWLMSERQWMRLTGARSMLDKL